MVRPSVELDDLAVMVFSSGTTGLPKAVRHSHRTMHAATVHWVDSLGMTEADRLQIATPPFHILGLLNLLAIVAAGASVRLHRRFDLEAVLSAIEHDRVTIEMAVAPIALAMASHPELERFDLSSLRYIMWGATPVTPVVAETITRRSGVRILPAYGASELPVLAVNPVHEPDRWRLDSVGLPPDGCAAASRRPRDGSRGGRRRNRRTAGPQRVADGRLPALTKPTPKRSSTVAGTARAMSDVSTSTVG